MYCGALKDVYDKMYKNVAGLECKKMREDEIIKGLRATILKYREFCGCKNDKNFVAALEYITTEHELLIIANSWKEVAIRRFENKLMGIMVDNCGGNMMTKNN